MCGIVGILGRQPVADSIVEALRRLEYRGYDSAGVATLVNGGIGRRRAMCEEVDIVGPRRAGPQGRQLGIEGIGREHGRRHRAQTTGLAHRRRQRMALNARHRRLQDGRAQAQSIGEQVHAGTIKPRHGFLRMAAPGVYLIH